MAIIRSLDRSITVKRVQFEKNLGNNSPNQNMNSKYEESSVSMHQQPLLSQTFPKSFQYTHLGWLDYYSPVGRRLKSLTK